MSVTTETAIAPLGGQRGLGAEAAGLSDQVRLRLANAVLDAKDPTRYEDALAELANLSRNGKSSRTRIRAAHLLLGFAARVAEWSLPKPGIAIQTNGPTTIKFTSRLMEEPE